MGVDEIGGKPTIDINLCVHAFHFNTEATYQLKVLIVGHGVHSKLALIVMSTHTLASCSGWPWYKATRAPAKFIVQSIVPLSMCRVISSSSEA